VFRKSKEDLSKQRTCVGHHWNMLDARTDSMRLIRDISRHSKTTPAACSQYLQLFPSTTAS
jgi:hypothetical protein